MKQRPPAQAGPEAGADSGSRSRRAFLRTGAGALAALPFLGWAGRSASRRQRPPNVLFVVVDDLRPALGCYGDPVARTPHLDRLAAQGALFRRAFATAPVCGPSRASVLSGLRPTPDRFPGHHHASVDGEAPGVTTLPDLFRAAGYETWSNGKVYHLNGDDADGWTRPPWHPEGEQFAYALPGSRLLRGVRSDGSAGRGPAYEAADVPDAAYPDGRTVDRTLADLRALAARDAPFFLSVGFYKPHLPFTAPLRDWALYDRQAITYPPNPFAPYAAPPEALHDWGELRAYYNVPPEGPLSEAAARTLRHAYYACVSFADRNVGRVVAELDRLGLGDDTVVVVWGDHGVQLGEHGLWAKHSLFDTALHAPLLVRGPGVRPGVGVEDVVEFVDIYPTLCELCGLDRPPHLQGTSAVPLLSGASVPRDAYGRYWDGTSVRTARYRYAEWDGEAGAQMLYDHLSDPLENVNVAGRPEYRAVVDSLRSMLRSLPQR